MQRKQKRAYLYSFYPTDEQASNTCPYLWLCSLRRTTGPCACGQTPTYKNNSAFPTMTPLPNSQGLKQQRRSRLAEGSLRVSHSNRPCGIWREPSSNFFEGRAAYPKFKKQTRDAVCYVHHKRIHVGRQAIDPCEDGRPPAYHLESRPLPEWMQAHNGDRHERHS